MFKKHNYTIYSRFITEINIHELPPNYDVYLIKCHDIDIKHLQYYNIIILACRDIRDCAISAYHRNNKVHMLKYMYENIKLFNKLKNHVTCIFKYEQYCDLAVMELSKQINLTPEYTTEIMKEVDDLHKSKDIVMNDDMNDELYKSTLITQSHNTSNGMSKKYLTFFSKTELDKINKNRIIRKFLVDQGYIV
jgi:hypothetical protein